MSSFFVFLRIIYSWELVELLFYEFDPKVAYIGKDLNATRKTASGYLASLKNRRERVYLQEAGARK